MAATRSILGIAVINKASKVDGDSKNSYYLKQNEKWDIDLDHKMAGL